MEEDWTWGDEPTIQYTGDVLLICIPETYTILLINVTTINLIKILGTLFIVVQVQWSPSPPHYTQLLHSQTYPFWICPCVLYTCSLMGLPLLSLSTLLSGNCQFVLYFNVCGCILLACLFC